MSGGVLAHREHLPVSLQLLGKTQLVTITAGSDRDAFLPGATLLALETAAAHVPRALQPPVDRRELLAGQHELLGDCVVRCSVSLALEFHSITEPEHIEQALDQLEVL